MVTRAQKLANREEIAQNLQRRLREIASKSAAPPSPPASKKRKTDGVPLLLTPHLSKPRTPVISAPKIPAKVGEAKSSVVKRVVLRRTLQYAAPALLEAAEDPQTVLQRICSGQLLRADSPIVGRAQEHEVVRQVLKGDAQGSLFIIGPPGTGKSSSVNELLREQGYETVAIASPTNRKRTRKGAKTAVRFNCSTFTDPAALYAAVAQQVCQTTSWSVPEAMDPYALDSFVAMQRGVKAKQRSVVLVLDEVDQLLRLPARMQPRVKELLHFLVRWAHVAPAEVKFLGIMNGVDMYEQVSRVHVTGEGSDDSRVPRVVFGSYSHQELLLILQSYVQRASSSDSSEVAKFIEPRAVELIARKVAARDGDARLAISLLQQSARHALQRSGAVSSSVLEGSAAPVKVTVRDVFQCATAMLSSPVVQQIKQLPRQAKLLLYVITSLAPGSNENDGTKRSHQCDMNQVSEELARFRGLPQTAWVPRLSREELQTHLMSLDCYALVKQGNRSDKSSRPAAAMSGRAFWATKLSSCVAMAEVSRALQDDTSLSQLLN
ncbi:hypothetical protein KRP22_001977 [Phytophthora ramorum]|nr:Cell division control protein 6-like protein [Phytophthora ramorum]